MPRFIRRKKKEYSKYAVIGDTVGVVHFLMCNLLLMLGEFTYLLTPFVGGAKHAGVAFVNLYIDYPVFRFLKPHFEKFGSDVLTTYLLSEVVIIGGSLLYGFGVYLILRVLGVVFLGQTKPPI